MIRQIGLASVYVSDQDRALRYYVDKLGFELISDQSLEGFRWIEVAPQGAETGMTIALGAPGTGWEAYVGGFAPLMFCDDLRQTCADFESRGVEFVESATEYPWGLQAILEDPDGNTIVMTQRSSLREPPQVE
jgi:predicted enzyme related to lactoylglutathione lyase